MVTGDFGEKHWRKKLEELFHMYIHRIYTVGLDLTSRRHFENGQSMTIKGICRAREILRMISVCSKLKT